MSLSFEFKFKLVSVFVAEKSRYAVCAIIAQFAQFLPIFGLFGLSSGFARFLPALRAFCSHCALSARSVHAVWAFCEFLHGCLPATYPPHIRQGAIAVHIESPFFHFYPVIVQLLCYLCKYCAMSEITDF